MKTRPSAPLPHDALVSGGCGLVETRDRFGDRAAEIARDASDTRQACEPDARLACLERRLIHSERRPAGQVPATESASVVFQEHKMQAFSLFGAFLLLLAYGGQQLRLIGAEAVAYQLLNLVGASILLRRAIQDQSDGFILLESCWMVVSLIWPDPLLATPGRGRDQEQRPDRRISALPLHPGPACRGRLSIARASTSIR
jgi:hypothetical protein